MDTVKAWEDFDKIIDTAHYVLDNFDKFNIKKDFIQIINNRENILQKNVNTIMTYPTIKYWYKNYGIHYQDTRMRLSEYHKRINISYGDLKDCSSEQVFTAAKMANADEFIKNLPQGYDTLIGDDGVMLSGGQRQRIAIARAILAAPKIIILDEATSSLDTESESLIQKSLSELVKNRTTIVIAHRLSTIKRADQILVIESGNIAERGTHDELIEAKGRYYDLYTYQAKI